MKSAAIKSLLLSQIIRRYDGTSAFVLPSSPSSPAASRHPSLFQHCADDDCGCGSSSSTALASSSPSATSDGGGVVESAAATAATEISKAPTLNGKVVLPAKAMTAGLKGHKVAAVYAVLDSNYKRGSGEGWEHVRHVDITRDLGADLSSVFDQRSSSDAAHVRALSFSYPQKATMEDFAEGWRRKVEEAGGTGTWPTGSTGAATSTMTSTIATAPVVENHGSSTVITVGDDYQFDDDDEDDDDGFDHESYLQMMAKSQADESVSPAPPLFLDNTGLEGIVSLGGAPTPTPPEDVISPFEKATEAAVAALSEGSLELTAENVDKVLDEVRPYLISDGGNVAVKEVDADTGNVYLNLEGACSSCASSTVTMKMGIERVLAEKFGDALGEVLQVDPLADVDGGESSEATGPTVESVQAEVNRISQAIVAMGGVVRVRGVDPIGEVEIEYRGPNRVRRGLELALLDVDYVKHVKFVS